VGRYLGDRLVCLADDPGRSLTELPVELFPVLLAIGLIQTAQTIDSLTSDRPLATAIVPASTPVRHSIEPSHATEPD
jgi:hypothetical protein